MQPPLASQSLPIVSRSFRRFQSSFKRLQNISPSFQKISIDFPESGLINGLKGERAEKINDAGVDRRSAPAPACWSFLPSSFPFLLSKRRAGAIFTIADGVFVRRAGAVSVRTWRPRSLIAREEERGVRGASPGHEPGDCGPRGKDGAIDPTSGKNTPASQEARTGFEPKPSGRAPALHALRVSHDACLFSLFPSVSPMRGG